MHPVPYLSVGTNAHASSSVAPRPIRMSGQEFGDGRFGTTVGRCGSAEFASDNLLRATRELCADAAAWLWRLSVACRATAGPLSRADVPTRIRLSGSAYSLGRSGRPCHADAVCVRVGVTSEFVGYLPHVVVFEDTRGPPLAVIADATTDARMVGLYALLRRGRVTGGAEPGFTQWRGEAFRGCAQVPADLFEQVEEFSCVLCSSAHSCLLFGPSFRRRVCCSTHRGSGRGTQWHRRVGHVWPVCDATEGGSASHRLGGGVAGSGESVRGSDTVLRLGGPAASNSAPTVGPWRRCAVSE